jgi:formate hydrogenlyase subunit 4
VPVDNPTTHLELTMLHEAQILEYSARHLALVEWAAAIKLVAYMTIGFALFAPWGIAAGGGWAAIPLALAALALKLAVAGAGLALMETLLAKMRIFMVTEFLSTAFLLAVLGMLIHFLVRG